MKNDANYQLGVMATDYLGFDASTMTVSEIAQALKDRLSEYRRLQAALARLAALPNSTEAWLEVGDYQITIRSLQYYDEYDVCATKHKTLLEACEAALAEYDKLTGATK